MKGNEDSLMEMVQERFGYLEESSFVGGLASKSSPPPIDGGGGCRGLAANSTGVF